MLADDPTDRSFSLMAMLTARYPHWTIWFGQATRHWWALPPLDRPADDFIEAPSVKELVELIEAFLVRTRAMPPAGGILLGEAETSRANRIPAAARPGGVVR